MRGLPLVVLILAAFGSTHAIAGDSKPPFTPGDMIVADFMADKVFEFDQDRSPVEVRSIPVIGAAGMAFAGRFGHLFVASEKTGDITEINQRGEIIRSVPVVDLTIADPQEFGLRGMVGAPNGNLLVSICGAEHGGDAVFELNTTTLKKVREIRQAGEKTLKCFGGIAFGPGGTLYVGGVNSGNVVEFNLVRATRLPSEAVAKGIRSGEGIAHGVRQAPVVEAPVVRDINILAPGDSPVFSVAGLAFDSNGNLYVSSVGLGRVAVIKPSATQVDHNIPVGQPTGIRVGRSTTRDSALAGCGKKIFAAYPLTLISPRGRED